MDAEAGTFIGDQREGETCVVCGKGLRPGEALVKMHESGSKLPICCPLCLEAYQKEPKLYLERLAKLGFLDELHYLARLGAEH